MSFLELNGRPTSCTRFTSTPREVGSRAYGLSGQPLLDRLSVKRQWRDETAPLPRGEATAIHAILLGQGHVWPFDTDDYSCKGLPAESGAVRTLRSGTAADGDPVYLECRYGTAAVAVDGGTTNILAADSRDAENAPNGYVAINGASIGSNAVHYWQGAKSVEVITDGSNPTDGVRTSSSYPGSGSAGKTYVGSVYVKAPAANELVKVRLNDVTNTNPGSWVYSPSMAANTWYRLECYVVIGGSDCWDMRLEVEEQVGNTVSTFYCDGFQVEESDAPTSWVDGTRSSGVLEYSSTLLSGFSDVTVNLWVRMSWFDATAVRYLFSLSATGGVNMFQLYRAASADNLVFLTTDAAGGNSNSITETSIWNDEVWHMITAVLRGDPLSTEHQKELYVDGVSVGTADPSGLPTIASTDQLEVGCYGGALQLSGGLIDDLAVLPYAASAAQVANWFALGRAFPSLPNVLLNGSAIRETDLSVEVLGRITGVRTVQSFADSTWQTNLEQIAFELEEL